MKNEEIGLAYQCTYLYIYIRKLIYFMHARICMHTSHIISFFLFLCKQLAPPTHIFLQVLSIAHLSIKLKTGKHFVSAYQEPSEMTTQSF